MSFPLPVWLAVQDELLGHGGADGGADGGAGSCFDDFDDDTLFQMFHLTRPCLSFVTDYIRVRVDGVAPKADAAASPSVDTMVMVALNYYAHGVSSVSILQKAGLSVTDCSALVCAVSAVLAGMSEQFVSFPQSREARASVAARTQSHCGVPNVLGVLAAAHFKVRASPYEKETFRSFVNSLGYTSVWSQLICDSDGNILSVEKCRVGNTFEQDVWDASVRGKEMEEGLHGPYWVIAGNGYNLSRHVLTPVAEPADEAERRFNVALAKMRHVMGKTIGSMKRRFRCLKQLGFAQEGSLDKQSNIIVACCVLHNITMKFSVPSPTDILQVERLDPGKQRSVPLEIDPEALRARRELMDGVPSFASGDEDARRKGIAEKDE